MGNSTRCPVCGGFGSPALGNYCKNHVPKVEEKSDDEEYKYIGDGYPGFATDRPFFSDSFGAIKDKFDIER